MKTALQRAPRLDDQEAWTKRFLQNLKHDAEADPVLAVLVRNPDLAMFFAVKIRRYVEPDITNWLYRDKKDRERQHVGKLNTIIGGLKEQKEIEVSRWISDSDTGLRLQNYAAELENSKTAFSTKRHGRDRAQFILYECYCFLLTVFDVQVTWEMLANLVAAGYNASGLEGFPSAATIAKNIEHFEERCSDMARLVWQRCFRRNFQAAFLNPWPKGELAAMIVRAVKFAFQL